MHPVLTQVPQSGPRSTTAIREASKRTAVVAADTPAAPLPIITRSYSAVICHQATRVLREYPGLQGASGITGSVSPVFLSFPDLVKPFANLVPVYDVPEGIDKFCPVVLQKDSAAHPDPSALVAAWVNSFLNRSNFPNSAFIASARAPLGTPPP